MDPLLPPLDHEELTIRRGRRSGLPMIIAVHSTVRGPALGGCRILAYDEIADGVRDALRLSRAMTYKAACSNLPLGGGKGVIPLPPGTAFDGELRRAALHDFGDAVERLEGRYVTAEDVGSGTDELLVIAEQTAHVTGLPVSDGGSGDPSPFTARGVEAAIRTTFAALFGDGGDLDGRTIAVVGVGRVGLQVAKRCIAAGATVTISDIDPAREQLAGAIGASWLPPAAALRADVDLIAPCALGGMIDAALVPELRCRAIAGSANNQLAADDVADLLAARSIVWAPDFVVNAGGIINIVAELEPSGYDAARARRRVDQIGATLADAYRTAAANGVTPLAAAIAIGEERLAAAAARDGKVDAAAR